MPATQYGPNLAETYLAGEQILGSRAKRQAAQTETKRQNRANELIGRYSAGDESAKDELLLSNPDLMKKYAEAVGKMDETQRARVADFSAGMAKYAYLIMNSKNPESEWARLYQNSPAEVQQAMGQQYSPAKVKEMYYNGLTMSEISKSPKKVTVGEQDMLFQHGRQIGSATNKQVLEGGRNRANMLTRANMTGNRDNATKIIYYLEKTGIETDRMDELVSLTDQYMRGGLSMPEAVKKGRRELVSRKAKLHDMRYNIEKQKRKEKSGNNTTGNATKPALKPFM